MDSLEKLFKDKDGRVVLWQAPNVYLWGWVLFAVVSHLTVHKLHDLTSDFSAGFIIIWAFLELWSGASWFRRVLGVIVLIASVQSRFN